jgi:Histidine kinase-, DNA gyrase B-, and HSP90-like ATPase
LRGAEPVTLKTGEGFYEGPNNVHIVGRNASNTKPAKFVVLLVTTSPNKGPATNPAAHTMTVRSLSPGIRPPDASSTNWLSAALRALQISDTGVGIPVAEQSHIFERFHRVRGTHSRKHEGTGIGLSLVQELVKIHGGGVQDGSSCMIPTLTGIRIVRRWGSSNRRGSKSSC